MATTVELGQQQEYTRCMTRASYPGQEHPIGYVEVQSSFLFGSKSPDELREHVADLKAKTIAEQPHLRFVGARAEHVKQNVNLYLGFEPKLVQSEATPPLDPRNLNGAPLPQPGMLEPSDGILPLGTKEQQFGRGT